MLTKWRQQTDNLLSSQKLTFHMKAHLYSCYRQTAIKQNLPKIYKPDKRIEILKRNKRSPNVSLTQSVSSKWLLSNNFRAAKKILDLYPFYVLITARFNSSSRVRTPKGFQSHWFGCTILFIGVHCGQTLHIHFCKTLPNLNVAKPFIFNSNKQSEETGF